jgi:hypothetical protein
MEVCYKSKTTNRVHTVQCDAINITQEHIECMSLSNNITVKIEDVNQTINIKESLYYIFRCTIIDDSLLISEKGVIV